MAENRPRKPIRIESSLDRLEKKLGARSDGFSHVGRTPLGRTRKKRVSPWAKARRDAAATRKKRRRRLSVLEFIFLFSIIFFIGAGIFASFLFFSGSNTVSTRNVNIAIDGPTEVRAGDVLPLQVVVTNQNTVPMELTDLVVEFPPRNTERNRCNR